jgi:hypothetical protein
VFSATVGSINESINCFSFSFSFISISIGLSIEVLEIMFIDLTVEVYRLFFFKNKYLWEDFMIPSFRIHEYTTISCLPFFSH